MDAMRNLVVVAVVMLVASVFVATLAGAEDLPPINGELVTVEGWGPTSAIALTEARIKAERYKPYDDVRIDLTELGSHPLEMRWGCVLTIWAY